MSAAIDEAEAIVEGIRDMYAAFLAGDRRRFDGHLAADATTWESHLPRLYDRAELDAYRDRRSPAETPVLDDLRVGVERVDVWGDVAVVRYVLTAVPPQGGAETTRVTDVLAHGGDGWRIVHHHAELRPAPEGERP